MKLRHLISVCTAAAVLAVGAPWAGAATPVAKASLRGKAEIAYGTAAAFSQNGGTVVLTEDSRLVNERAETIVTLRGNDRLVLGRQTTIHLGEAGAVRLEAGAAMFYVEAASPATLAAGAYTLGIPLEGAPVTGVLAMQADGSLVAVAHDTALTLHHTSGSVTTIEPGRTMKLDAGGDPKKAILLTQQPVLEDAPEQMIGDEEIAEEDETDEAAAFLFGLSGTTVAVATVATVVVVGGTVAVVESNDDDDDNNNDDEPRAPVSVAVQPTPQPTPPPHDPEETL